MFAAIFIPDFSTQAILRLEPVLRGDAVAVLSGRSPLEKVMSLNENARQAGVEIGATKSQLEAWGNLTLRARSEVHEQNAHAALLDCAQSFSPEIEDTAPGIVLVDLTGLKPLLGALPKIAGDLARRVAQLGLEANIAVAANPDAALLAAHGFPSITLIPEGHEEERLGDLAVDVLLETFSSYLEEAARWVETFDRWGIRKLRSLAALPEVPVSERLGHAGIRLQKLARGEACRKLRVLEPPAIFVENVELEFPIVLLEPLAFVLHRMLEQICARLSAHALAAQELKLQLELAATPDECGDAAFIRRENPDTRKFIRSVQLPLPMLDAKVFLKLLQLDLQAHPPGAPIVKIHLAALPARPRALQSGLFQPLFPEAEKLELTLARIAAVVGEGRAGSVELLDSHREGAFAVHHFTPTDDAQDKVEDDAQQKMTAVIALRLFRPPLGVVVTVREAKPVRMQCPQSINGTIDGTIAGAIVWTAGPWRSSGDWSEDDGWSREEWDIAVSVESGLALYRLVQDKLTGSWFLEGTYD
ncbi:MAG TPA: DNA polymerase Y family protein [Terriglobales bacterium]|nr:DNA polymerase Y family protein [Terriglobales bacterium]